MDFITLVYYITYILDYNYNRTLSICDKGMYSEYDLQLKSCSHNVIGNIIVINFLSLFYNYSKILALKCEINRRIRTLVLTTWILIRQEQR